MVGFNVIEVTAGPFAGRLRVVTGRNGSRLKLRGARWLLCNTTRARAEGFVLGYCTRIGHCALRKTV